MKTPREEAPREARHPLLLGLGILAALLAVLILAGTAYGLATGSRRRAEARAELPLPEGSLVFELGSIRGKSSGPREALVAAVVSFPYPAGEREYREELLRKKAALRAAAISYFRSRPAAELHPAYEGAVKAGLREAFNALLSLGKVGEVWLSDYAVME